MEIVIAECWLGMLGGCGENLRVTRDSEPPQFRRARHLLHPAGPAAAAADGPAAPITVTVTPPAATVTASD